MKKTLILVLIFLTACTTSTSPTSASYFNDQPAQAILTDASTSEQIQQAMLESARKWRNVRAEGTVTWYDATGTQPVQTYHEQVWIDQLTPRFRSLLTVDTVLNTLKFSDGQKINIVNMISGHTETTDLPEFVRVGQYVPPLEEGAAYPNPLWGQIGTPLSEMMFSANFIQTQGTFKAVAIEMVVERETLVVEWTYIEKTLPTFKVWLDTHTAVILRMQQFGDDSTSLQGERIVEQVAYDEVFDPSLFTLPSDLPQAIAPTQVGSLPVVTESGSMSMEEAGELYFFLQPRQAGQSIQLAKVSGVCVYDSVACPSMQIVNAPFAFNFTINALSWSPDGKYAAFSYSDNTTGTPTKLWLFDANAGTWTSLAEFAYIDPPFWSPDGSWIAFRTQDGLGGEDVYIVRRDGTELRSVSTNLPMEGRPYIMDGWYTENIIMRSALPGTSGSIYLVRANDGVARPMFDTLLTKAQFVASPDASLLVYDDYASDSQNHVLKVMEPDGANAVTLANFAGGSIYPVVWSPDSKLIAFNYYSSFANGEPKAEVYVIGRDGSNLSIVYAGITVGRLVFSPNGRYLLVEETTSVSGGHLFLIDLATLEQRILQAPGLSMDYDWYAPSWRP